MIKPRPYLFPQKERSIRFNFSESYPDFLKVFFAERMFLVCIHDYSKKRKPVALAWIWSILKSIMRARGHGERDIAPL